MNDWICQREEFAQKVLKKLGLKSLKQLSDCSLLIHVIYGGMAHGGISVLVKVKTIELRQKSIYFDFSVARVQITFDAQPGKDPGGVFQDFDCNTEIEIEGLGFDGNDWTGIFWVDGTQYEMHQENLSVKVI